MTERAIQELIWTLVAGVGAGFSLYNLWDAKKDRSVVKASGRNGVLLVTATGNIRREAVRLVFWGIAIVVGVAALTGVDAEWIVYALIVFAALSAYNSAQDGRERRQIRRLTEGGSK